MAESRTRREIIEAVISDIVADLMYYDRKEDEDLPRGAIEEAVLAGEITWDEIVKLFKSELIEGIERAETASAQAEPPT